MTRDEAFEIFLNVAREIVKEHKGDTQPIFKERDVLDAVLIQAIRHKLEPTDILRVAIERVYGLDGTP